MSSHKRLVVDGIVDVDLNDAMEYGKHKSDCIARPGDSEFW